ncbi:MAG: tRNA (cytidine(34)-2'-O)-methyltransferase [Pseudomonadota bacterium]|nr:tRNA (cytidine(34)-2'-O)-methyltransferase [Pseudomonadota bacterium]
MEIALYQPDIAPNAATIGRMCACFGLALTIIEPAGFAFTDSSFRRAGMDYLEKLDLRRVASWQAFQAQLSGRRLVLLSTKASVPYTDFTFQAGDTLLLGRESAGVPSEVHAAIPNRVRIPMMAETRSLNVAMAAAIVTGEALRQIGYYKTLV